MTLSAGDIVRGRLVVVAKPPGAAAGRAWAALGARDVLVLSPGAKSFARQGDIVVGPYRRSADVGRNNAEVAVLHGDSAVALRSLRFLGGFGHVLVPLGPSLALAGPLLARLCSLGQVTALGPRQLGRGGARFLAFRVAKPGRKRGARIFGPLGEAPLATLRRFDGLDYVLLRWAEAAESGAELGDLDILAADACLGAMEERLAAQIGTFPIDLYGETAPNGHGFKGAPYFTPAMARHMLAEAVVRPSGIRVPSPEWAFVSFCFHLLFHKSAPLAPGSERLDQAGYSNALLLPELGRLAAAAGARCPETFAEIEAVLRAHGGMPPRDTIGIYSGGNRFLQARYAIHAGGADTAGLGVFVVRDLGIPIDLVELRAAIEAAGFTVVAERPIAPGERAVIDSIRGGNWSDVTVAGRPTPPIHCLVCFDPKPIRPGRRARRKYPRLDNERMLVKEAIRLRLGARLGTGRANFLHGSDNAAEALDYVEQLGLAADPRIAPLIARAGGAEGSRGGAQHG